MIFRETERVAVWVFFPMKKRIPFTPLGNGLRSEDSISTASFTYVCPNYMSWWLLEPAIRKSHLSEAVYLHGHLWTSAMAGLKSGRFLQTQKLRQSDTKCFSEKLTGKKWMFVYRGRRVWGGEQKFSQDTWHCPGKRTEIGARCHGVAPSNWPLLCNSFSS